MTSFFFYQLELLSGLPAGMSYLCWFGYQDASWYYTNASDTPDCISEWLTLMDELHNYDYPLDNF